VLVFVAVIMSFVFLDFLSALFVSFGSLILFGMALVGLFFCLAETSHTPIDNTAVIFDLRHENDPFAAETQHF
jgi:hypothetical protein